MANRQKEANNLGVLFTMTILIYLFISLLSNLLVIKMNLDIPWWGIGILAELEILIPCLVYVKSKGKRVRDVIPFRKIKVSTVFFALLLVILISPAYMFANLLSQIFVPNIVVQTSSTLLSSGMGITILMTVVLAPICEELAMRGVFYHRYKDTTSLFSAVLISAFFFGLIHLNLNQFCYAFVIGLFFALANIASGSIWTSILMHAVTNAFGTLILIGSNAASSASAADLAQTSESFRTSNMIYVSLAIIFVFAVIGVLLGIRVLKAIAKREGNTEALQSIFRKKEDSARVLFNLPTMIGVLLCFAVMYGWDKVLEFLF